MKAKIQITLRKSILDTQGKAVHHALENLGYTGVSSVRLGKYIEVDLGDLPPEKAKEVTDEMCRKLLANTVMEDYAFELEA